MLFEWPEELEEHVWEFVHSDFKCKWKAKRWNDIHKHILSPRYQQIC